MTEEMSAVMMDDARSFIAMCTPSLPTCLQRRELQVPPCPGDIKRHSALQYINKEILLEVDDNGVANEGPYFAHGDIKHGHGGDFLVQQYLQNINKKQENNNDTTVTTEPNGCCHR